MSLAGLVLAAGAGRRLRPLSLLLPKPLHPVDNDALLDRALATLAAGLGSTGPAWLAVNAHHLAARIVAHVGDRAHVSVERPVALGTAGAVGALRGWLDGRDVLIANGDAYLAGADVAGFVAGWDGRRPRLLVVPAGNEPADFPGGWRFAGVSLLPGAVAAGLPAKPSGLYELVWRDALAAGRCELVPSPATTFIDCGTPARYLAANLHATGGASVVGPGARVAGELCRSVVWAGATVRRHERLRDTVRATLGDVEITLRV